MIKGLHSIPIRIKFTEKELLAYYCHPIIRNESHKVLIWDNVENIKILNMSSKLNNIVFLDKRKKQIFVLNWINSQITKITQEYASNKHIPQEISP